MKGNSTRVVAGFVTACFILSGSAQAGMIGTPQLASAQSEAAATQIRADNLAKIDALMARDDVRKQMIDFGVKPEMAQERVASLSDSEIQQLSDKIDQQQQGGGVLIIAGVVFIVLIILELVGVTHIFSKF